MCEGCGAYADDGGRAWPEHIISGNGNSKRGHLKGLESVRKPSECQVSRLLDRTSILLRGDVASYKVLHELAYQGLGLDTCTARYRMGKKLCKD